METNVSSSLSLYSNSDLKKRPLAKLFNYKAYKLYYHTKPFTHIFTIFLPFPFHKHLNQKTSKNDIHF